MMTPTPTPTPSNSSMSSAFAIRQEAHAGRDPLQNPVFYQQLSQRYLLFDAFVAGQRRVELDPLVLSQAAHRAAVEAAEATSRVIGRVTALAHHDATEAARYGFHPEVLGLARASHEAADTASLARVDLLLDEDGVWRACEINADCPGGHNEALALPRLAQDAGYWQGVDPTTVVGALCARLAALAGGGTVALLYATAYAEDLQVCALVRRGLAERGVRAVLAPPTAPRLRRGRLCVNGEPVTALYRFFPTEYMEGQGNLGDLVAAVRSGAVRTLSSFTQIFPQSKLAFARAFSLRDRLRPDEQRALERHLPRTLDLAELPISELLSDRTGWVVKRALGRVGDEVFVGALVAAEAWPQLLEELYARRASGEVWIAQRFVRQRPVPTPHGPRLVTLGAYLLDGTFVGYFARLSVDSHVGHDALCVPVFVGPARAPDAEPDSAPDSAEVS
jgi:hypothetical protein